MGRGVRLFSILGFEVRIDYSWFIIFFLILWTLTFGVFPALAPGLSPVTYFVMGGVGTLLFFASIVGHELSHSLVARRLGIPIEGITLFVFGGMAHTRMEFEEPADEFRVAGIGPVSSVLIGALFYGVAWVGAQVGWPVSVIAVASYLAFINVLLAVFNLLPGFPLDGGRLFRAAVWKATGDLRKATRWAANGGKVLGYVLIALGILNFFAANLIGGLWLVFIGWFVRTAAEAGYLQHALRSSLSGVPVRAAMTPRPTTVQADTTVQGFVDGYVFGGRHHGYPVVEDGRPVGIVTLDAVRRVPREAWPLRTVKEVMIEADEDLTVGPEESMDRVLERLAASPARRVLVVDGGRLAGIVTQTDVARWLEGRQLVEGEDAELRRAA